MAQKFYPAEQTDTMLKLASDTFHGLADLCRQLGRENAMLKAAAEESKIELQKVAASKHTAGVPSEKARQYAEMLASRDMIDASQTEKYASSCTDPNVLIEVAMQALRLKDAPVSQGEGVKEASSPVSGPTEREKELWLRAAKLK